MRFFSWAMVKVEAVRWVVDGCLTKWLYISVSDTYYPYTGTRLTIFLAQSVISEWSRQRWLSMLPVRSTKQWPWCNSHRIALSSCLYALSCVSFSVLVSGGISSSRLLFLFDWFAVGFIWNLYVRDHLFCNWKYHTYNIFNLHGNRPRACTTCSLAKTFHSSHKVTGTVQVRGSTVITRNLVCKLDCCRTIHIGDNKAMEVLPGYISICREVTFCFPSNNVYLKSIN